MADAEKPPLLVLLGPTAVGKSFLALGWAERVGAEIVAADSTTVYRGTDIGTAKPTPGERRRVPHHLIDVADPEEQYTAARFQQDATQAIHAIGQRGRLPLVVGGTGLWVRALLANFPLAPAADPAVRQQLNAWWDHDGPAPLLRQLKLVDPASAAAIAPGDRRRVVRALEVYRTTGRPLPRQPGAAPYRVLRVGLWRSRPVLWGRIEERARRQLADGLLEELLALHARGVAWRAPAFVGLGYREGVQWARGRLESERLLPLIGLHTRQYAKRQMTWLAREPDIRWINLDESPEGDALAQVLSWTSAWLHR